MDNSKVSEAATLTNDTENTKAEISNRQLLEKYIGLMKAGKKVTIACYGDSTYWGHASGVKPIGSRVKETPVMILQKILRKHYNNNKIKCVNYGEKGYNSNYVFHGSWDMESSNADIIFVNYGINDAGENGLSKETYRYNIENIVDTVISSNKVIILETPNIVLSTDPTGMNMGNEYTSKNLIYYVDIMREISATKNVTLVDNYLMSGKYYKKNMNCLPDGMHPSDALYSYKAKQMATALFDE
jgi:lysophospholipase L1-like esterase